MERLNKSHLEGFARQASKWMAVFAVLVLTAIPALAQEQVVKGIVTDANDGSTVPGVNILIKGTSTGVTTDFDGNYSVSVTIDAVLVFSFVGYKPQEITVGSRTTIDVALESDIAQLAEIIVVGYGTQEAKDVTGVVSTVDTKDFNKGAIASPESLISGKVAGVSVTPSTEPGGGSNIVIRGVTSLNSGISPLIVLDGVIIDNAGYGGGRNALNFINPSDIESMTILKDASAAAIYGARAAAGVILVTTKSGKAGEAKLTYDGYFSYAAPKSDFGFLSPSNFRAAVANAQPSYLPLLGSANTNWVDEVIQPVTGMNHNVSMSGGSEKTTFSISLNHMENNGIVKFSQNKVTRANVKVTTKLLNDNLTFSIQQRSALTKDNFSSNVTGTALTFDPTQPIYDSENEEYGGYWEWQTGLAPSNPVSTLEQIQNNGETRRNFTAINADYKVPQVPGLALHVIGSSDFRDGKYQFFRPTTHLAGANNLGSISNGANKAHTYNFEPYISYETDIDAIGGSLEVMAGYSYQETFFESFGYSGDDLTTDVYGIYNPAVIGILTPWDPGAIENHLQAGYGRVNLSINDKYLLTSNIRYDGSTRFGPENRYGLFPSVALGWRIMDEEIFAGLSDVFTDMKVRVGWGQLGNQAIGDFRYEKFYFLSTNDAQYQFGANYSNMLRPTGVDPQIQWETTTTTNIGIDFGLMDNRLSGTLDFYNKATTGLLATVPPPAFTNVSDVVTTNVAEMTNTGVELGLNIVAYDQQDFDWNIGFNAAWNKNEIVRLTQGDDDGPGLERGGISGDVGQTIKVWKVGEAYDAFRTYVRDPNGVSLSGEFYEDVNDDGQINEDDLQITGNPAPDVVLGLTSSMTYKNFALDFTLRGNIGNEIYNNTASANGYYLQIIQGGIRNNIHESVLTTNYNGRQLHSDFYIENGSFLRIDNVTLSYNYDKLSFMKGRIYATAQNLLTLSGYSGPNPEISGGIDNNLYPIATTYIVGINVNF